MRSIYMGGGGGVKISSSYTLPIFCAANCQLVCNTIFNELKEQGQNYLYTGDWYMDVHLLK